MACRRALLLVSLCFNVVAVDAAPVTDKIPVGLATTQLIRGPENHLLLPAKLNGRPATLLVDTGSDLSFLQGDRASSFGVRSLGRDGISGGRSFPLGAIDDLRVGNFSLGATEVALYSPGQFRGPVPGRSGKAADGIIGLDVLRRQRAVINCRTQQIFFQAKGARRLDLVATTGAMGFTRVPIEENRAGYLSVPCSIGDRNGRLALDTGAFITLLDDKSARAFQLHPTPSKLTARTVGGRVRRMELAQVDNLKVGDVAIAPQRFAVMDLFGERKETRVFTGIRKIEYYDARLPRPKQDLFGLLGSELLFQRSAIIDLGSMSLFLK